MNGDNAILIIDDDEDYSCLLQLALQEAHINNPVEVLADGSEAITYLGRLPSCVASFESGKLPALIFLDVRLPHQSGFEVLRWMRGQPGLSNIPVVVFTGSIEGQDPSQAVELGAVSLLVKPFSYSELVQEVTTIRDSYLHPGEFQDAA